MVNHAKFIPYASVGLSFFQGCSPASVKFDHDRNDFQRNSSRRMNRLNGKNYPLVFCGLNASQTTFFLMPRSNIDILIESLFLVSVRSPSLTVDQVILLREQLSS